MQEDPVILFSRDEASVQTDLEQNRAHKEQVLARPTTIEQRQAQEAYLQEVKGRAALGFVGLTPRQKRVSFAVVQRDTAISTIAFLSEFRPDATQEWEASCVELAQAYFQLGEFEQAQQWCPPSQVERQALYKEFRDAVNRPDTAVCSCQDSRVAISAHHSIRECHDLVLGDFPSPAHNAWVFAIRCIKCGFLNLRPELTESATYHMQAHGSPQKDIEALKW